MSSFESMIRALVDSQMVKVALVKDMPPLNIGPVKLGQWGSGDIATLPFPMAITLIRSGAAQVTQQDSLTVDDVRRALWIETKEQALQQVDKGIYIKAKLNMASQQDPKQLQQAVRELAVARLRKILYALALSGGVLTNDITDRLTPEEAVLAGELGRLISTWLEWVVGYE